MARSKTWVLTFVAWLLCWGPAISSAQGKADRAWNKYVGQIVLLSKPAPRIKGDGHLLKVLNDLKTQVVRRECPGDSQIYLDFFAFLPKALLGPGKIKVFDITGGRQNLIDTYDFYPDNHDELVVGSQVVLDMSLYEEERQYWMMINDGYQGKIFAEVRFALRGRGGLGRPEPVDFTKPNVETAPVPDPIPAAASPAGAPVPVSAPAKP